MLSSRLSLLIQDYMILYCLSDVNCNFFQSTKMLCLFMLILWLYCARFFIVLTGIDLIALKIRS